CRISSKRSLRLRRAARKKSEQRAVNFRMGWQRFSLIYGPIVHFAPLPRSKHPSQETTATKRQREAGAWPRKAGRIRDPAGCRDHSSYLADPAWKGPGWAALMEMVGFPPLQGAFNLDWPFTENRKPK